MLMEQSCHTCCGRLPSTNPISESYVTSSCCREMPGKMKLWHANVLIVEARAFFMVNIAVSPLIWQWALNVFCAQPGVQTRTQKQSTHLTHWNRFSSALRDIMYLFKNDFIVLWLTNQNIDSKVLQIFCSFVMTSTFCQCWVHTACMSQSHSSN